MAMPELRAAVVGAGKLGSFHAEKYARMPGVRLVCVADIDRERAERLAAKYHAEAAIDCTALKGQIDLASITTSTLSHFRVAADLIGAGIDVLIEKPMTATVAQDRELAALGRRSDRVVQIGHLERFNPAIVHLRSMLNRPRFIECHRLAPFTERGTDVDVILDLMIHDLDVILSLCGGEVASIEAVGVAVLTESADIANARLRFKDGLIANVTTSRVSARRERKIRFFQPDAYISVDYEARALQVYRKSPPAPGAAYPTISADRVELGEGDALADEIASFVASVRERSEPAVTVADGLRVIEVCEQIKQSMSQNAERI